MTGRDYVSFMLGGQSFGIPVHQVRDVLRRQPITPIPLAPPAIVGLLNLRVRLGLPLRGDQAAVTNLVVELGGELYALIVDAAGDVLHFDDAALAPLPVTLDPVWRDMVSGIFPLAQGFMVVLDIGRAIDMTSRPDAA
jgi:purine-binding chemotaxis protein CheW